MKVGFVVGSLGAISGGNYVALQHASHCADEGDEVCLITLDEETGGGAWHPALRRLTIRPLSSLSGASFDIVVPTFWKTVFALPRIEFGAAVYFVQSIETRMQPAAPSPRREVVRRTYELPMPAVTEARWIAGYLETRFGRRVELAPNGLRHDLYRPDGPAVAARQPGSLRILVEGPLGQKLKNVARAVTIGRRSKAAELWLLTQSAVGWYPGADRVFSRLPVGAVPAVYRSCDVLVKLSFVEGMFGPPLEMFGCGGTAIVYDVTGADEYMAGGRNGVVCPVNDEDAVIRAIDRLAADPDELARLQGEARATAAAWPDWTESSARFRAALLRQAAAAPPRDALRSAIETQRPAFEAAFGSGGAARRAWRGFSLPALKSLETIAKAWALGRQRPHDLSAFRLD